MPNARSRKDGTVHHVDHSREGPHKVKDKKGDILTLEGVAHWFDCGMWARESAVELVEDAPTCVACIAKERLDAR